MTMDYRIKYGKLDGRQSVIFCEDDLAKAKRLMKKFRTERIVETEYAELYGTDWDNEEDADVGFRSISGFIRVVRHFGGMKFPTGRIIEW